MKRAASTALQLLLLVIPVTAAAAPGNGVDISWNACIGQGTEGDRVYFDCAGASNRTYSLMVQFKIDHEIAQAAAWTAYLDFLNQTGDLGDATTGFWRMESACPGTGVPGVAVNHVPPPTCEGVANLSDDGGSGISGMAWFSNTGPNNQPTPGRAKILAAYARADGITLVPETNYYVLHLIFNNRNRTACPDGCSDPGLIAVNELVIEGFAQPAESIGGFDKYGDLLFVNDGTWETPVRNVTWGSIKAQYR